MELKAVGLLLTLSLFLNGCINININEAPGEINEALGGLFSPICGNYICEAGDTEATCEQDCREIAQDGICGNDICEVGESDNNCPMDCELPNDVENCGNGVCEPGESVESCAEDCTSPAVCGNGACEIGETLSNCPSDCSYSEPICGNHVCEGGESSETCPSDCSTINGLGNVCGNDVCEPGETSATCSQDCGVITPVDQPPSITVTASPSNPSQSLTFDLTITAEDDVGVETLVWESAQFIPFHEHSNSFDCNSQRMCSNIWVDLIAVEEGLIEIIAYATDTSGQESGRVTMEVNVLPFVPYTIDVGPICGNDVCQEGETISNCPQDCIVTQTGSAVCGNGVCETGETSTSCSADCQAGTPTGLVCGNGVCQSGETSTSCPADCGAPPPPEDECDSDSDCGYKEECRSGQCVEVECTSSSQCGTCERCSDNVCRSCGSGPYGCYC